MVIWIKNSLILTIKFYSLEKFDNKFQPGNKVALTRIIEIYNNNKNE